MKIPVLLFWCDIECFMFIGYLKETDVCGIKWVSGYPANMKQRLPMIVGMIILNNPDNGE